MHVRGKVRIRRRATLRVLHEKGFLCLFSLVLVPGLVFPGAVSAEEALYRLNEVEKIGAGMLKEPEDVAIDVEGNLYAGCADGIIYRVSPRSEITCFVRTGGRPLGLFSGEDGRLFVCDVIRREILAVTPEGEIQVLADSAGDRPLFLPDDICAARDGTVYFTDATTYPYGREIQDLVRGEALGRLIRIRPDGTVEVLRENLYFPNGVTLNRDETVLYMAEMGKLRILEMPLAGENQGEMTVFVDGLPGLADGISMDADGNLLVAIMAVSEEARKRVEGLPVWLRRFLSHLPPALLPSADPEGMVLRVRPDRTVEVLLSDRQGAVIPCVTNVIDGGDSYYMGFLYEGDGIARLPRARDAK